MKSQVRVKLKMSKCTRLTSRSDNVEMPGVFGTAWIFLVIVCKVSVICEIL